MALTKEGVLPLQIRVEFDELQRPCHASKRRVKAAD